MKREKSEQLFGEAKKYFPGGVNSPVRAFKSVGGTPVFIQRGDGAYVWDVDGNQYLDFCCSWGPLIHGHNHPHVRKAIVDAVQSGTSFGAPTEKENLLAELILRNNSVIEKIRFVSSGTEAVMSAVRLARGATKRKYIVKFDGCYHGHVDALLVNAGSGLVTFGASSSAGVTDAVAGETLVIPLNNKKALDEVFANHGNEIAAVIIEPVPANNGLLIQEKEFLSYIRNITKQNGSLLIFDEVISGFRIGFSGAAAFYDIQPDIVTYGKIIGGGMPVGAYGGSAQLMSNISPEGNVYQAGTLSGNPVAMAAGYAQLELCLEKDFYNQLESKTKKFCDQLNDFATSYKFPFKVFRLGSIFWFAFTSSEKIQTSSEIDSGSMKSFRTLYHDLLSKGIYMGPSGYEVGFVSSSHTEEDLMNAADVISDALKKLFVTA